MKRNIIIALLLLSTGSFAQTHTQIVNLTKIAKVWGFLKYYHPSVATGTINWDAELIRMVAASAQRKIELNKTLESWYRSLPQPTLSEAPTQPKGDSILTVFDEKDIRHFKVNARLMQTFLKLFTYHLPDSSRYLTNRYKQYTLDFLLNKENEFGESAFPNRELRLLALFRYWNIINYQYPHKRQLSKTWDKVLPQFIPMFWQATSKIAYQNAVQKLTAAMQDSHSFYKEESYTQNQRFNVAFELSKFGNRYFVNGIYNSEIAIREGIKKGDEILSINGMHVKTYERVKLFGVSGSNQNSKNRDQARQLLRADTTKKFNLLVIRNGRLLSLKVQRYTWETLNKKSESQIQTQKWLNWKELEPGVWHVKFCAITTEQELKEMFDAIKTAKKVIWDMRGYPVYALLPQTFASLMTQKTDLGWTATANLFFPGTFTLRKDIYVPEQPKFAVYNGAMIVLVNAQTQSLAESVSAQLALRPNTILLGTQTAGTTGNINYFDLPGGIQTSFTAVGFYGAKSTFIQTKGVKINVKVNAAKPRANGSSDAMLHKALSHQLNTSKTGVDKR